MKHLQSLFFLLLILIYSDHASAENWCDKNRYTTSEHILAWENIKGVINPKIEALQYDNAYLYIQNGWSKSLSQNEMASEPFSDFLEKFVNWKKSRNPPDMQHHVDANELLINLLDRKFDCDLEPSKVEYAIIHATYAFHEIAKRENARRQNTASARITTLATQHENKLLKGLPMWPWELWANSLWESDVQINESPRRSQLTLLRPGAGVEFVYPNRADAEVVASLAVEPIGIIWYRDDDYDRWWGLSPIVTIGSDHGAGYGLQLRYNSYALGITDHSDFDDPFFFLSIDLYNLVNTKEKRKKLADDYLADKYSEYLGQDTEPATP